jgi:hypothetical protein
LLWPLLLVGKAMPLLVWYLQGLLLLLLLYRVPCALGLVCCIQ